jgi:hypothetical protein
MTPVGPPSWVALNAIPDLRVIDRDPHGRPLIQREKQIKGCLRAEKISLIEAQDGARSNRSIKSRYASSFSF